MDHLQEDYVGPPSVIFPQQMYSPQSYLQPARWYWTQQQLSHLQHYGDQYQGPPQPYGASYLHPTWSLIQQQYQHHGSQTGYNCGSFTGNLGVKSTKAPGNRIGYDFTFSPNTLGEGSYSMSNRDQLSGQLEKCNRPRDITGTWKLIYILEWLTIKLIQMLWNRWLPTNDQKYLTDQAHSHIGSLCRDNRNDEASKSSSHISGALHKSTNGLSSNNESDSQLNATHTTYSAATLISSGKTIRKSRCKTLYVPAKRRTVYSLFFSDNIAQIRESNPAATFGDISKAVSAMWRKTNAEVKDYYENRLMQDRELCARLLPRYMRHPEYVSKRCTEAKHNCTCNVKKSNVSVSRKGYAAYEAEDKTPRAKAHLAMQER